MANDKEKSAFLRDFGRNAEAIIYKKFKSKEQFLRESGFYTKNLHDILTGKSDLRLGTLRKLAKALGVKPSALLPDDLG